MSSWKKANRDVLFADSMENKTTLYGFWTAMDYGNAKVRDQHFAIVCDVLDKYDVDGLDFDFSRYLPLFREVSMGVPASPEQREQFTDLMRRIRRAADARGRERGKAILISVVLPDSVDYCRELGADIEQWIREELIDIWTQPEMFRLNTAADAVAAARTRGIPFYPQVGYPYPAEARNPTLLSRLTPESYAARIAAAFAAGAPGVICSDLTCPSEILNVIHRDPESIRRLDKRYFVTDLLWEGVNAHLASGETHLRKTMLTPTTPLYVSPGIISNFKLEIGDDPEAADKPEPPLVRGFIRRSGGDPGTVEISSNGKRWLRTGVGASYESFEIPDGALKPGVNDLIVTTTAGSSSGLFAPLFESGKFRRHIYRWFASDAPDAETITPEGLLIRDTGNHERDIANVAIAYNERGSARVFDFECRVIDSDDDLAVCARGADGLHYETVSLRPGRVRLMNSGFEYELDTTVFHRYVIILTADQLRFEIDGSEVFQTPQELKPLLAEVGISLLSYYLDGNEISIP